MSEPVTMRHEWTGKPFHRKYSKLEILFTHLRRWFFLRRWLIRILAGNCSVMVNVDYCGTAHYKGPWLLNYNVVALNPTHEPCESGPLCSPKCDRLRKQDT